MYNPNLSYKENYEQGPFPLLNSSKSFPKLTYTTEPKFNFLGAPLHIPFGVPAGPLLNSKFVRVALNAGFCFPIYKTVRSQSWACNPWPNVLSIQTPKKSLFAQDHNIVQGIPFDNNFNSNIENFSISNSFGVPSQEMKIWSEDFCSLLPYSKIPGYQVGLSYQGTVHKAQNETESKQLFIADTKKVSEFAKQTISNSEFQFLEINLSCPNERHEPIYRNVAHAINILKEVNLKLSPMKNIKLIIKIGVLSKQDLSLLLNEGIEYFHGISLINTISADILNEKGLPALGNEIKRGGVCGRLIFEQGLQQVTLLAELREQLGISKNRLGIIGVGGVSNSTHFQSYINAGADVVQSATGMMWNLNLAHDIANYLNVPTIFEEN